jgi:chromosome segregation ATPase
LRDELKSAEEIDAEVDRQMRSSAQVLGIPPAQVFAVSAQKALVAKVNGDDALLARSRIPQLEQALSKELIPAKREIVGSATRSEVRALSASIRPILDARIGGIREQLAELKSLRGKNQDVVEHMMDRIGQEKESFERGMQRYTALRTVFTQQTTELYQAIGLETLRETAGRTRRRIEDSPFTRGVRSAMSDFFENIRANIETAALKTQEIHDMMAAMYGRFAKEHGLEPFMPPAFSMLKYQKEVDRLERAYNAHLNTLWNMVSKAKFALMKRFFETIAIRVKHVYDIANRDLESWLKALMAPLETQVREHHIQLRRRLESVKRIHRASEELEERLAELEQAEAAVKSQIDALAREVSAIDAVIDQPEMLPLAANA